MLERRRLYPIVVASMMLATSAHAVALISGCPLFPADNIWNTPIDTAPVDPDSATYVATIGGSTHVHPDFGTVYNGAPNGIPYVTVPGSQAMVPISFTYANESDPGPYPIPPNPPIEGGPGSTGDRHVLIVETTSCTLYEIYNAKPQTDGTWRGGSGAKWNLNSNALRPSTWTSADAAGLPILPGLVRYDEVASGEITHALRFTVPQTRNSFVWPGRHQASALTGAQYPQMGQRFRLKADFNIATYSPAMQVILRALKKYGMMLSDNGSAWYISGAPDPRWDDDDLHTLQQVTGNDFEAVNVAPLQVAWNSGQAFQPTLPPPLPSPPAGTTYDIDGNGKYDPLTDGLLMFRYMFGLRGAALVSKAVAADASRNAEQIETYLGQLGAALDVDGNHVAHALTDGVMLLRRLFGVTGPGLIEDAIGIHATRTTVQDVTDYINGFMP